MHNAPALDMVFAALADPTRRAILSMLLEDDMAVTDVAEPFEPDALRDASIWMQSFGQFEAVNLDAFERFLKTELPDEG
jgi:DNA-binding transcriptional ArsR family regulator